MHFLVSIKRKIYILKKLENLNSHINIINVNSFCLWPPFFIKIYTGSYRILIYNDTAIDLYKLQWRTRKLKTFQPFLFPQSIIAVFFQLHRITLWRDAFGITARARCRQGESHSLLQNSSEVTMVTDMAEHSVWQTEKSGKFKC